LLWNQLLKAEQAEYATSRLLAHRAGRHEEPWLGAHSTSAERLPKRPPI